MANAEDDMDKLYELGEKLARAENKAENETEYMGLIEAARAGSKGKLFAASQLPRFFKFFPGLSDEGINALFDLCEDEELQIRITAIRGLPFVCKDTPEYLPRIADALVQLLTGEEQEHAVVQNSLMQVVRQSPKESLVAVFKHIDSADDRLRENVLSFVKTKIISTTKLLLQADKAMERHVVDLIKGIRGMTDDVFAYFLGALKSLELFGSKAPTANIQELLEFVEAHANLGSSLDGTEGSQVKHVLSCLREAIPLFARGASPSTFLGFVARTLLPEFQKLDGELKTELLKVLAEGAPHASAEDARALLPGIVSLLKDGVLLKKTSSNAAVNLGHLEALLYAFNVLGSKASNATNRLCGYKVITGQPSDQLGEDSSGVHAEWLARLGAIEEEAKKAAKAAATEIQTLTKDMHAAKGEALDILKEQKTKAAEAVRCSSSVEKLIKGLKSITPVFLTAKSAPRLSWVPEIKGAAQPAVQAAPEKGSGVKSTGASAASSKRKASEPQNGHGKGQQKQQEPKKQLRKQHQQQQEQQQKQQQQQPGKKQRVKQHHVEQQQQQLVQQQQRQLQLLQLQQQQAAMAALYPGPAALSFMGVTPPAAVTRHGQVAFGGRGMMGRGRRRGRGAGRGSRGK